MQAAHQPPTHGFLYRRGVERFLPARCNEFRAGVLRSVCWVGIGVASAQE
jgi:hypothetical protein